MKLLNDQVFDFISMADKSFIRAFNHEMTKLGYEFGGHIGSGYCWGKNMIIYRRSGVKSDKVFARIYIREKDLRLRLFFSSIDKHRAYIEAAPAHVKEVFVGEYGNCDHCHNEKDGKCRFRKSYTIDHRLIEKCNGLTFEFPDPTIEKLPAYINLFLEFYPHRKSRRV
jgi:hypothetical protein